MGLFSEFFGEREEITAPQLDESIKENIAKGSGEYANQTNGEQNLDTTPEGGYSIFPSIPIDEILNVDENYRILSPEKQEKIKQYASQSTANYIEVLSVNHYFNELPIEKKKALIAKTKFPERGIKGGLEAEREIWENPNIKTEQLDEAPADVSANEAIMGGGIRYDKQGNPYKITFPASYTLDPESVKNIKEYHYAISPEQIKEADKNVLNIAKRRIGEDANLYEIYNNSLEKQGFTDKESAKLETTYALDKYPFLGAAVAEVKAKYGKISNYFLEKIFDDHKTALEIDSVLKEYENALDNYKGSHTAKAIAGSLVGSFFDPLFIAAVSAGEFTAPLIGAKTAPVIGKVGRLLTEWGANPATIESIGNSINITARAAFDGAALAGLENAIKVEDVKLQELASDMAKTATNFAVFTGIAAGLLKGGRHLLAKTFGVTTLEDVVKKMQETSPETLDNIVNRVDALLKERPDIKEAVVEELGKTDASLNKTVEELGGKVEKPAEAKTEPLSAGTAEQPITPITEEAKSAGEGHPQTEIPTQPKIEPAIQTKLEEPVPQTQTKPEELSKTKLEEPAAQEPAIQTKPEEPVIEGAKLEEPVTQAKPEEPVAQAKPDIEGTKLGEPVKAKLEGETQPIKTEEVVAEEANKKNAIDKLKILVDNEIMPEKIAAQFAWRIQNGEKEIIDDINEWAELVKNKIKTPETEPLKVETTPGKKDIIDSATPETTTIDATEAKPETVNPITNKTGVETPQIEQPTISINTKLEALINNKEISKRTAAAWENKINKGDTVLEEKVNKLYSSIDQPKVEPNGKSVEQPVDAETKPIEQEINPIEVETNPADLKAIPIDTKLETLVNDKQISKRTATAWKNKINKGDTILSDKVDKLYNKTPKLENTPPKIETLQPKLEEPHITGENASKLNEQGKPIQSIELGENAQETATVPTKHEVLETPLVDEANLKAGEKTGISDTTKITKFLKGDKKKYIADAAGLSAAVVGADKVIDETKEDEDGSNIKTAAVLTAGLLSVGVLTRYRDPRKISILEKLLDKTKVDKAIRFFADGHGLSTLGLDAKDTFLNIYYDATRRISDAVVKHQEVMKKLANVKVDEETAIRYLTNAKMRQEFIGKVARLPDGDVKAEAERLISALDLAREHINTGHNTLFSIGALTPEQHTKWGDNYTRRTYDKKLPNYMQYGRKYTDIFEDLTAEERAALKYVEDAKGEIATTLLFQARLISRLALENSIAQHMELIPKNMHKYLIDIPEVLRVVGELLPQKSSPVYLVNKLLNVDKGVIGSYFKASFEDNMYSTELKSLLDKHNYTIEDFQKTYEKVLLEAHAKKKELEEFIKKYPEASTSIGKLFEKYSVIPSHERYGAIAGLMIDKSIASQIVSQAVVEQNPYTAAKFMVDTFDKAIMVFKFAKTVGGLPLSAHKNFFGNWVQTVVGGVPIHKFPSIFLRGLKSLVTQDELYKKSGVLGSDFASQELKPIVEVFNSSKTVYGKTKEALLTLAKIGTNTYSAVDMSAKIGMIDYYLSKNMTLPEAIKHASNVIFDYSLTSSFSKAARSTASRTPVDVIAKIIASPFMTYSYKTAGLTYEMFKKNPVETIAAVTLSGYLSTPILNKILAATNGATQEDIDYAERVKPFYLRELNMSGYYNKKTGEVEYITASSSPYSDLFKHIQGNKPTDYFASLITSFAEFYGTGKSPISNIYFAMNGQNKYGKPLVDEISQLSDWESLGIKLGHSIYSMFAPALVDSYLSKHPMHTKFLGVTKYVYTPEQLKRINSYYERQARSAIRRRVEELHTEADNLVNKYTKNGTVLMTPEQEKKVDKLLTEHAKKIQEWVDGLY